MEEGISTSFALLEILRGYSIFRVNDKKIYFKHFSLYNNLSLEEYEIEEFFQSVRKGIKTEKQLIEEAIHRKYWSIEQEEKIKTLSWLISKSEAAAAKITDNLQKSVFQKSIDSQREELADLEKKRTNIILYSAENFASGKKNAKLIKESMFYDEDFKSPANEEDSYFVMDDLRSRLNELTKETTLVKAAYDSYFFDLYTVCYREPLALIKRDITNITVLQKNLLSYAAIILNKLKNVDMPDSVREDPMKIIKYSRSEDKDRNTTEGIEDIKKKMANNEGKLKAEDLLS